jgi:hypothetical protein
VQSGTSLPELMELGGWKSYEMVLRYAHLAPEKLSFVAGRIERQASKLIEEAPLVKKRSKKRYVFATVGTLMLGNFLIEKCARTDCCGAYGPLASLTLGSPCGRPNRLRRFVELPASFVASFLVTKTFALQSLMDFPSLHLWERPAPTC